MAQPTSLADARAAAVALGSAAPTPTESVRLADAAGRVAAEDVAVRLALPTFHASAMDGWAVRSADLAHAGEAAVRLRVADEARAGRPASVGVLPGTAVRISTGAPLPAGADAVVRVEDAEDRGEEVVVGAPVPAGRDVRRAGEDIARGAVAVAAGAVLHAGRIALLAGTGVDAVACRRRPRVTVVVTGDEVASGPVGAGEVHDVNGVAIPAVLRAAGADVVAVVHVGDDRAATLRALADAPGDVVVSCGGASVGPHDHVRPALATLGARERVGAVAVQPGKPTWLGVLPGPDGDRPVVALPGNPGAAVACAVLLAVPLLHASEGREPAPPRHARLAAGTHGDARRVRALRATLAPAPDGAVVATVLDGQQPHRLGSLAATEAFALVPPSEEPLAAGAVVEVVPVPGIGG